MEETNQLLRTTVRTFFPSPRQVLALDALLQHRVLHLEDFAVLLSSQSKELRSSLTPLRTARLLQTATKAEYRVGQVPTRSVQREYYYIDYRLAIDAVKYKIMKLRKKVTAMYSADDIKRKDWKCPRCGAEYDELEVMLKIDPDKGFVCDRCGSTLKMNEEAKERGSHAKIVRMNEQLAHFEEILGRIDKKFSGLPASEGLFEKMYATRIKVQRPGGGSGGDYIEADKVKGREKRIDEVKAENLQIKLTSSGEHDAEEKEREQQRRREVARQNQLPLWHTQSAIGMANASVKAEEMNGTGVGLKGEDEDEKKPDLVQLDMQDEVQKYIAEMERERLEAEQRKREESEEEESDEEEFEDVVPTNPGTPVSSGEAAKGPTTTVNGIKRELQESSSEAGTPASLPDAKRIKLEETIKAETNGTMNGTQVKTENDADSDGDEDFEDAM